VGTVLGRGVAHLTIYLPALALQLVVLPRVYGFFVDRRAINGVGGSQGAFRLAKPKRARDRDSSVARGRLSKQIAHDIGIAEATVKVHRSRTMQKMNAGSLRELGRMADKLKLVPDKP
jgi:Bacterial regulatory proteins, luxR family